MEFLMRHNSFDKYLQASEAVDYKDPKIQFAAQLLMDRMMRKLEEDPVHTAMQDPEMQDPEMQLARITYEYVRDRISHSWDIQSPLVTWKASDVLEKRHGLCYAKSHLLAALLRANGIPAGLCYQYLRLDGTQQSELILHGLNAVYFASIRRWIRLDARGNKTGIAAEFSADDEKLAFPVHPGLGETDIPIIFAAPDRTVLLTLQKYENLPELMENLPQKLFGDE
jgi:Transglutaminase-like superfamily